VQINLCQKKTDSETFTNKCCHVKRIINWLVCRFNSQPASWTKSRLNLKLSTKFVYHCDFELAKKIGAKDSSGISISKDCIVLASLVCISDCISSRSVHTVKF